MDWINDQIRENIRGLKPYSSARDEYSGTNAIFLDANENPRNAPYNRYPDPMQLELKNKIGEIKGLAPENIFLGNGSDEAIDLLFRIFCTPGRDRAIAITPSYGMYKVCADINDVEVIEVSLTSDYQLDEMAVLDVVNEKTKLLFLCSPNNPTGNSLDESTIVNILGKFKGIVIVDEAYIDFSPRGSLLKHLGQYPNLVILQTLSKAWGLAGIRLGMAFASKLITSYMNKVKYPYNVNILTQQKALETISDITRKEAWVKEILDEKVKLASEIEKLDFVQRIFPSDANFILVKVKDALPVYDYLVNKKIIVRNRSNVHLCAGCLRITIGTRGENSVLMKALQQYKQGK